MSAYIVFTRIKTIDQKELEIYWASIQETLKGHPIEILVPYGKFEVLEGEEIEGMVIAKFPTMETARKWYFGDDYQRIVKHRQKGAIYQGILIEGIV
ncbi:MAG: hypothetical protein COW00_13580 [Bdellovibrio sp. CG12_big_fil_rev_8_21_14_0_65_39_13]|nr:MAG: hypothetical protein COW78_07005 [Bdellovibrio sp. CG22_combo_CG10-13_8_21_14_all_39_27]PIQ58647.1 MAG: hypothetical protein COW00_13580 [Bdellovibrio sp. CG12_big_fil_rev_8_21_14_0_65_39_13]PIR33022.1 MAG: hypothetical protein COV37_18175 [Bdellovibrio sp. CG11_big_fil_rev_8_21_14_0_20_39_38]